MNVNDYLVALELSADALENAIANFVAENSPSDYLTRVWIALLIRLTEACLEKVEDAHRDINIAELFVLPLDVLEELEKIIDNAKLRDRLLSEKPQTLTDIAV